jgi:hypothetical protein
VAHVGKKKAVLRMDGQREGLPDAWCDEFCIVATCKLVLHWWFWLLTSEPHCQIHADPQRIVGTCFFAAFLDHKQHKEA